MDWKPNKTRSNNDIFPPIDFEIGTVAILEVETREVSNRPTVSSVAILTEEGFKFASQASGGVIVEGDEVANNLPEGAIFLGRFTDSLQVETIIVIEKEIWGLMRTWEKINNFAIELNRAIEENPNSSLDLLAAKVIYARKEHEKEVRKKYKNFSLTDFLNQIDDKSSQSVEEVMKTDITTFIERQNKDSSESRTASRDEKYILRRQEYRKSISRMEF